MRASSFVGKSRTSPAGDKPNVKKPDVKKPASALMTMMPTIILSGIVGSNWAPAQGGSLSDPAGFDPSMSSAELWKNKYEVHPDTPKDDPVFRIFSQPPSSPAR